MSSDFNFTVTSWFLGNVHVKPYFNTKWLPPSKVDFCAPPPNKSARKMTSFRNYPRNHISYGMEPGLNNVNISFFLGDMWENSKKVIWSFVYFKGSTFLETICDCHISKILNEICVHQKPIKRNLSNEISF